MSAAGYRRLVRRLGFGAAVVATAGVPAAQPARQAAPCFAPRASVALDHVIVAVPDLDEAGATYRALGFTLKPGRLHPNGILNLHAKLADGTELELLSLAGEPGDDMARRYAAILAAGGGGAYVALRAPSAAVVDASRRAGVASAERRVGPLRYVTLGGPGLEAVFFIESTLAASDPDSIFVHANGAKGLVEAWVEGTEGLDSILVALGAVPCEGQGLPEGRKARRFGVANGTLAIVPAGPGRARLLGASLAGHGGEASAAVRWLPPDRALGVWLGLPRGP